MVLLSGLMKLKVMVLLFWKVVWMFLFIFVLLKVMVLRFWLKVRRLVLKLYKVRKVCRLSVFR